MKCDLLNCFTQLLIISKTKQETDQGKRLRASSLTVQSTRISFFFLQRLNSRRLIIDENVDHKNDVISRLTIVYHDLKYLRSIDRRKKIHSGLFEETTFYFRVWKPGFCNNQVQSTRISFFFLQRLNSRRLIIDENVDHKNDVISRLTIVYHDLKYLRSIDRRKKIHSGLFEETTFYFRVWKPGFCNNQVWLLQDHRRSLYCKLSETVQKSTKHPKEGLTVRNRTEP